MTGYYMQEVKTDIQHKVSNGKKVVNAANATIWSKEIEMRTKKKIYH